MHGGVDVSGKHYKCGSYEAEYLWHFIATSDNEDTDWQKQYPSTIIT